MRLIPRHRQTQRGRRPRIAISQAEITADLHYRGGSPRTGRESVAAERSGAR